ncbi:small GTPase, putative [Bodo saltans]|uniref:Small GTPase, putative n=1 Tax=Bodo saltans TaxID=75058 RepID=A0A0S4J6M9_BODSA|nr:small GTPase, putative [Bodo saltans]|eukprot:CUG87101.1 small GTPase, putative [Bodo saltans]
MDDIDGLPKVLLMGLKKSGKTSIQKVVFDNLPPHDSINLKTTVQPEKTTVKSNEFVKFEVWDFPGQSDPLGGSGAAGASGGNRSTIAANILENCGAIVFVMDCTDNLEDATKRLIETVCAAHAVNPDLCVEVFLHKVDALNEVQQNDHLLQVRRSVEDVVKGRIDGKRQLRLSFNLTSIYDHSVFQAFSVVVQKLIRTQLPYVLELLGMLNGNSQLDLTYLFLSRSKIFIGEVERNRTRTRTYDLCSDAIDVMMRVEGIYGGHLFAKKNLPQIKNSQQEGDASSAVGAHLASSVFHLSSDDVIYVRELPNELTVVMMLRDDAFQNKALIDFNVNVFSNAVSEVFQAGSSNSR